MEADLWDIEDAIYSTATYLAKNGAAEGRIRDTVYAYNHSDCYVEDVIGFADRYVKGYVEVNSTVTGSEENTGIAVVNIGNMWIGNSVYVFWWGKKSE